MSAPLWLTVAFQVYLYVGGAFGLVAATNTSKSAETESEDPPVNVYVEAGDGTN